MSVESYTAHGDPNQLNSLSSGMWMPGAKEDGAMLGAYVDSVLAGITTKKGRGINRGRLPTAIVRTTVGPVRVYDSNTAGPCVVFVPDGPNVIEHYEALFALLTPRLRVVCFDMPGFGFSLPERNYEHSLVQGANAVLGVLDAVGVQRATLAFSCANGFYAMRAAALASSRVTSLVLAQTPSLTAMRAWTDRVIPWPVRVPVVGQVFVWALRKRIAQGWYDVALPKGTDRSPYHDTTRRALADGACNCLASVVQGLAHEQVDVVAGLALPCTMVWGPQDRSHRYTEPDSLHDCIPGAEIVSFDECGHFPDLEAPTRYAEILFSHLARHARD
jgi:pimeloyl-ACP methyl ester carboxylesterase